MRLPSVVVAFAAVLSTPSAVADELIPNFFGYPSQAEQTRARDQLRDSGRTVTRFEKTYELLPTSTIRWTAGGTEQLIGSFVTEGSRCRGDGCEFFLASGVITLLDLRSTDGYQLRGPVETPDPRLGCALLRNSRKSRWALRPWEFGDPRLEWQITVEHEVLSHEDRAASVRAVHIDAQRDGRLVDRGEPHPDEFEFTATLTEAVLRASNVLCEEGELVGSPVVDWQRSRIADLEIRAVARP